MLNNIGARIRKARENKGISQKKLGMMLGLSDKAISSYESGRTFPPIDTLYRIAQDLGQDIEYFISQDKNESIISEKLFAINEHLEKLQTEITHLKSIIESQEKN